jgi:hypothetical protein
MDLLLVTITYRISFFYFEEFFLLAELGFTVSGNLDDPRRN